MRFLVLLVTLSASLGELESHRRSDLKAALSSAFDRDSDGTVTLLEATHGIRSFADAVANETRDAGALVFDATNRNCERPSPAHTNDAAYVLDCTAEFARRQVRRHKALPSDEVKLSDVFAYWSPAPTLSDSPPEEGRHCEDLVDEAPRSCDDLTRGGYCLASCSPYQRTRHDHGNQIKHTSPPPTATTSSSFSVTMLVTSDWHMEPWYDTTNNGGEEAGGDYRVSRYAESTADNRYACRSSTEGGDVAEGCPVTNRNDPPSDFVMTHLDWFVEQQSGSSRVALIVGDVQAHDETQEYMQQDWIENIYETAADMLHQLLARFSGPDAIFLCPGKWTGWLLGSHVTTTPPTQHYQLNLSPHLLTPAHPGNNDGPHSTIFVDPNDEDDMRASWAWAQAMVDNGIVTNGLERTYDNGMDQIELFNSTGYYLKPLSGSANSLYVMHLNTNLGSDNSVMNAAITSDLQWVKEKGNASVIALGHHPTVMSSGINNPMFSGYEDVIFQTFSGHTHIADDTNTATRFTQVGAVSQGGTADNGFYIGTLTAADLELTLKDNWVRWAGPTGAVPQVDSWECCGRVS